MTLIIDLLKEPKLVLKKDKKEIDSFEWEGLYQLSETLLLNIERFLKKNKVKLEEIKNIKVIYFEHHYDLMIKKGYKFSDIHNLLLKFGFNKYFKEKMVFRKSFEYIYINSKN